MKYKAKMVMISGLVIVAGVAFMGFNMQGNQTEHKVQKYADARLSMVELKQGIEVKIDFLLQEIEQSRLTPTKKGLMELTQSIEMIRAYGNDISKEAKENLRKIVWQLKSNGFEDEGILKKLDEMARGSQEIVV